MAAVVVATTSNGTNNGLDQLRQRLSQMSTSIASLKADLERNEPLPSWSSLQSSAQILSHNLSQLMATFDAHREYLTASHAYPLPHFPGHTREELLNQLLRKRLEPRTEEWLNKYDTAQTHPVNGTQPTIGERRPVHRAADSQRLRELWSVAGPRSNAIVKSMVENGSFDDDFTLEEQERGIENVNTGLQRNLTEDEDDEVEDTDMIDGPSSQDSGQRQAVSTAPAPEQSPMPIENILRFISTGGGIRPA